MKKHKVTVFLIFILLISLLILSKDKIPEKKQDISKDDKIKIGLSFDSLVVERWQRDLETFISYANEKGIEVNVQISNDDISMQKKQVQDLIYSDIDILIILPGKYDSFQEELRLAEKEKIKVIAYDRLLTKGKVDLYISFDNVGVGENLAEKVVLGIGDTPDKKKNIIIINGDPNDNNSKMINQGIYNTFKNIKDPSINIIAETWSEGWREDQAFSVVEETINEGQRIDGIIAANDILATGAVEALAERSLSGDVIVVGQDAELSACQRIVEESQLSTIYKPIDKLSKATVDNALKLIFDEKISYDETIENNYKNNVVPYLKLDFIVVTKENIDNVIIDSGFHDYDSVYVNVKK